MLADIVNALTARLGGVPIFLGRKYLATDGTPPRVVLIPTRDKLGPPERVGGNPRAIHTRWAGIQAHVWGADFAATEVLAHQLLVAMRAAVASLTVQQIAPNGYRTAECGWLDQGQGWTDLGEVWVGNFEFGFPVLTTALPTKTVTDLPMTAQLETPGSPPTEEDAG